MRVAWALTPLPFSSAARSFAATLLLSAPPLQAAARLAATGPPLLATARPKQLLLRRTLALTNPHLRNISSTSTTSRDRKIRSNSRVGTSSAAARACSATATSTAMMGDTTGGGSSSGGGGGTGGDVGLTLPIFLERCSSSSAREQHGTRANTAATAAPGVLFHVFSGNEACDADSMCSAICMAFLRQVTATAPAAAAAAAVASSGADDGSVVYVPVMPIPRADLALRREVLVLFELCGIEPSAVIFSDELDLPALQAEGRLRLTLVDHNAVSGGLCELGDAVVEIVDHHMDLEEHPSVQGASRDIAFEVHDGSGKALVGSCCTIVAERMLEQAPTSLSSDIARLLLGVILVDTVNLDTDAKRATQRDVAAAEELSRRVSWTDSPSEQDRSCTTRNALFDTLRNAKMDPAFWRELSANDCLRYDFKSFLPVGENRGGDEDDAGTEKNSQKPCSLKFGVSSILCRLETLAQKGGEKGKGAAGDALRAFAVTRGLDSLAVMTVVVDDNNELKKELLVFTHSKLRFDQMQEYFEGPNGEFLKLEATAPPGTSFGGGGNGEGRVGEPAGGWFLRWELGNVRPSRKQVAPAIAAFYESVSAG